MDATGYFKCERILLVLSALEYVKRGSSLGLDKSSNDDDDGSMRDENCYDEKLKLTNVLRRLARACRSTT